MLLLEGKPLAAQIQSDIAKQLESVPLERRPGLTVILVGEDPASQVYVGRKVKACEKVGIHSKLLALPASTTEPDLLQRIDHLNQDPATHGILVQLPLPSQINPIHVIHRIDPRKDVDGFHPLNMGMLMLGEEGGFVPCTPLGILKLLQHYTIETAGKHAVILGRSNIVGKPLAALLWQRKNDANATVTIAHTATRDLPSITRSADILISAVGKANSVTASMIKEGAVVVDVGMNRIEDPHSEKGYRLTGDVAFDEIKEKCSAITPVPGGVGPMTIAMLLHNTLKSFLKKQSN